MSRGAFSQTIFTLFSALIFGMFVDSRAWRTPAGRGATRFASPRPRKRVERSFCAFHDAMKARGGAVERGGAMTTGLKTTIFDRLRSRERACAAAPGAVGDGCDL